MQYHTRNKGLTFYKPTQRKFKPEETDNEKKYKNDMKKSTNFL